jgi:hypothetical protein
MTLLQHPDLLHCFLTIALIHDNDLALATKNPANAINRSALAFHWYHATVLFKKKLARTDLTSSDRDSLWISAALLGGAAFGFHDTHDPYRAWPLRDPDPMDLDWLKMAIGKRVVWKIADPTRDDSFFKVMSNAADIAALSIKSKDITTKDLPPAFHGLFNLTPESAPESNPYHTPAITIAGFLYERCTPKNFLTFLMFLERIDDRFQRLLEEKDPRALLLLCWWYAKVCVYDGWWLCRRAVIEGRAICIYLDNHCVGDKRYQELLRFPRNVFSLVETDPSLAAAIPDPDAPAESQLELETQHTWPGVA